MAIRPAWPTPCRSSASILRPTGCRASLVRKIGDLDVPRRIEWRFSPGLWPRPASRGCGGTGTASRAIPRAGPGKDDPTHREGRKVRTSGSGSRSRSASAPVSRSRQLQPVEGPAPRLQDVRIADAILRIYVHAAHVWRTARSITKRFLLLGIDEYDDPGVGNLLSCVVDAAEMRDVLAPNGDGSVNFDCRLITGPATASVTWAVLR